MLRLWAALLICLVLGTIPGSAGAPSFAPTGPGAGVKVEVPMAGIGLTIPAGWYVSVDYRRADPPPGQPIPAPERWHVLTASDPSEALDGCRLFRYEASGSTLEAFARELMSGQPSTVTPLLFDAGESVRIDLDLGGPEVAQQWLFGSGTAFYQLACLKGEEPPDARWLFMAESIELLPESHE